VAEYANAAFEDRRRPRTKLWAGLAIGFFVVLAAVLYSAFWFDTAARLKDGIIEWTAAQRAAGNFVVFNNLQITGFPLSFTLSADQAVLGRTDERTFSWRAEGFRASARPWAPRNLTIATPDNGATYSARGNSRNVEINAAALRMEVQLDARNWPNAATAHFDRPVLQILGVRDDIAAASLVVHFAGTPDGQGTLALEALDVTSGHDMLQRLGGTIDRIKTAADINGAWSPGPVDRQLDAWRLNGGTVDLHDTRLEFGGLVADVEGTMSLDDELRPLGALTATFLGLTEFVDRLQQAEIIRPRDAAAAKISINLLSERTESGRLRIPITAQFGRLAVGPLAFGDLMPIPEFLEIPNLQ
jgi:hypothetical protein